MNAACLLIGLLAAATTGVSAAQTRPPAPAPVAQATVPAPPGTIQQAQSPAPAPTLGRMFFTPTERATLDEMRKRPAPVVAQEKAPQAPPGPEYVTLNGVVRRSDGTTTVWLNNKPVQGQGQRSSEGLILAPGRAGTPGNVIVVVPQSGRRVDLKVGQQLDVTSGRVQEPYRASRAPSASEPPVAAPADAAPERSTQRRPGRDRELLRELLREIDGPAPGSGGAGESAGGASAPRAPG